MEKSYKKEVAYLLKKVVNQPCELDIAKCDNYIQRMVELIKKTNY